MLSSYCKVPRTTFDVKNVILQVEVREMVDTSRIRLHGVGIGSDVHVNQPVSFVIDPEGSRVIKNVSVVVRSRDGIPVDVDLVSSQDGTFTATYVAPKAGPYEVILFLVLFQERCLLWLPDCYEKRTMSWLGLLVHHGMDFLLNPEKKEGSQLLHTSHQQTKHRFKREKKVPHLSCSPFAEDRLLKEKRLHSTFLKCLPVC